MNNKDFNAKKNLIKLATFFSVVLVSMFLIMAAINMLDFKGPLDGKGESNDKRSSINDNHKKDKRPEDLKREEKDKEQSQNKGQEYNSKKEWKDRAEKRRQQRREINPENNNPTQNTPGNEYAQGDIPKSSIPNDGTLRELPGGQPDIGISGGEFPDMPFGKGEKGGNSFGMGDKRPHIPIFEVLGKPNYPFVKVMTMENYSNNYWTMAPQGSQLDLGIGNKLDSYFKENTVKIKPIEPSKGFVPVLSGQYTFKYNKAILKYESADNYFAEEPLTGFYEMTYRTPPDEFALRDGKIDESYQYSVTIIEKFEPVIDKIIDMSGSDYESIKNVEKYLQENYTLNNNLKNNMVNSNSEDGITRFLMGSEKEGNTLDFMSAYTYILRTMGIPCRMVLGYRLKPDVSYQVVYFDQVYIYPEVKFENYGWVPMDVFGFEPFYIPKEETSTNITHASESVKRGSSFNVKGTVKDKNGKSLDDMTVLIYVKSQKSEPAFSYDKAHVTKGKFDLETNSKDIFSAGKYQVIGDLLENDTYKTSTSDPEMKVVTETFIELEPLKTYFSYSFNITGKIGDDYSGEGIPDLTMNLSLGDIDKYESIISKEDGKINHKVELDIPKDYPEDRNIIFAKKYTLNFIVDFRGTEIFFPSSSQGKVVIWEILWMRIIILIAILIIIPLCFILPKLIKRLLRKRRVEGIQGIEFNEFGNACDNGQQIFSRSSDLLIRFPFIDNGLPDVWGINEELIVHVEQSGEVCEIKERFTKKSAYVFKINNDKETIAKRRIKIVDYREEIITLGKSFLENLSGKNQSITSDMTIMEVMDFLKDIVYVDKHNTLEEVLRLFEIAVYSEREVVRKDYVKMYQGIRVIYTFLQ